MAHHKRRRPNQRRDGCLLCRPSKLNAHKTADRMKARREWQRREGPALGGVRKRIGQLGAAAELG